MLRVLRVPVLTMTAEDVLSLHWRVDADVLRPRLPTPLDCSLFDGAAWLSVVAFRAADLRPRGIPRGLGRSFPELRLQTYVCHRGTPGRYFFSIDAGDRLVAHLFRLTSRMPYAAADAHIDRVGDEVTVTSRRDQTGTPPATFEATGSVEGPTTASDHDRWVTGHRRVFGSAGGTLWALDIARGVPDLESATAAVQKNTLFKAAGVPSLTGAPVVRYNPAWPMHASLPWWVFR